MASSNALLSSKEIINPSAILFSDSQFTPSVFIVQNGLSIIIGLAAVVHETRHDSLFQFESICKQIWSYIATFGMSVVFLCRIIFVLALFTWRCIFGEEE